MPPFLSAQIHVWGFYILRKHYKSKWCLPAPALESLSPMWGSSRCRTTISRTMSFHSTPTLEQDVRDCSWKYRSSRRHTFHSWLLRYGRQASLPRPWSGWWGWWCGQPCTWSASPRWLAGSRGPPPRWARPGQPPWVIVIVIVSSTTTLCNESENLWIVENSLGSSNKGAGDAELPLHSPGKILALLVPLVRDSLEAPPCIFDPL